MKHLIEIVDAVEGETGPRHYINPELVVRINDLGPSSKPFLSALYMDIPYGSLIEFKDLTAQQVYSQIKAAIRYDEKFH